VSHAALRGSNVMTSLVVGAGLTGLSPHLIGRERMDVAVVEAKSVGWGASGRHGLVKSFLGFTKSSMKYGVRSAPRMLTTLADGRG